MRFTLASSLWWGWRRGANRNCHGRNRCRQSLELERKKRKSPCENTKPKCARNIIQWRDWWMLIEMNSINSYFMLSCFRKFSWQSRKVEGDAGKLYLNYFLITPLWISPRYRVFVTPRLLIQQKLTCGTSSPPPPPPRLPSWALITPLTLNRSPLIQTDFLFFMHSLKWRCLNIALKMKVERVPQLIQEYLK